MHNYLINKWESARKEKLAKIGIQYSIEPIEQKANNMNREEEITKLY